MLSRYYVFPTEKIKPGIAISNARLYRFRFHLLPPSRVVKSVGQFSNVYIATLWSVVTYGGNYSESLDSSYVNRRFCQAFVGELPEKHQGSLITPLPSGRQGFQKKIGRLPAGRDFSLFLIDL
jgi:hypothetical protein